MSRKLHLTELDTRDFPSLIPVHTAWSSHWVLRDWWMEKALSLLKSQKAEAMMEVLFLEWIEDSTFKHPNTHAFSREYPNCWELFKYRQEFKYWTTPNMTNVQNMHPAIIQPTPPLFQFFLSLIPTGCRTLCGWSYLHAKFIAYFFPLLLLCCNQTLAFPKHPVTALRSFWGGFPCKKVAENSFLYFILFFGQFLISNKKFLVFYVSCQKYKTTTTTNSMPCGTCSFTGVSSASCWMMCTWFFKSIC